MEYSSELGCFFYYDRYTLSWCSCEPTLLFLLGLEATLSSNDNLNTRYDSIDLLTRFFETYKDTVYKDFIERDSRTCDNHECGCVGVCHECRCNKLTDIVWCKSIPSITLCERIELFIKESPDYEFLLRDFINTRESGIILPKSGIPIYKNILEYLTCKYSYIEYDESHIEIPCAGLKYVMNLLTGVESNRIVPIIYRNMENAARLEHFLPDSSSFERLLHLFHDAGYEKRESALKKLSRYGTTDLSELERIDAYNRALLEEHRLKQQCSQIYKLIDYRAMYSYALGVLYGCYCLGYNNDSIWRVDPAIWYDGDYLNLVISAYEVFRYRYGHPIPRIDCDPMLLDKYKGIQANKLWNFSDIADDLAPIYEDELLCHSKYIDSFNNLISIPLIYSLLAGGDKGSYLKTGDKEWKPLDSLVLDEKHRRGIISSKDVPIVRYLVNDAIPIERAYQYKKGKYLSPNADELYFVSTANLGWCSFDEKAYQGYADDTTLLTLFETGFDRVSPNNLKLAREKTSGEYVVYYEGLVNDKDSLYGLVFDKDIIDKWVAGIEDDRLFSKIVTFIEFENNYEYPIDFAGYTLADYYNIEKPISIYVWDEDDSMMFGGDVPIPIVEYGYTKTPAKRIDAYVCTDIDGTHNLTEYDLRYNADDEYGYWSNLWTPREWRDSVKDVYEKQEDEISLYRGETVLNVIPYYKCLCTDDIWYIFNNDVPRELDLDFKDCFVRLYNEDTSQESLYKYGITEYDCEFVTVDDYGNSLLDEYGNPLVWYDDKRELFWNGLLNLNRWQKEKPTRFTTFMFVSDVEQKLEVLDKGEKDGFILSDGTEKSYIEYYAIDTYGIIRETLLVQNKESLEVSDCYHDSYSEEYCVPRYHKVWVSKEGLSKDFRIVDGYATLYLADVAHELLIDKNPED